MGKKSPKAPPAPDPVQTAAAQSSANREAIEASARFNQIGQESPFGRVYYTGAIGSPDRKQVTQLNPLDRQALDQQRGIGLSLGNLAGQAVQQIPRDRFSLQGIGNIDQARADRLMNDTFKQYAGRINDQYDRNDERLRTQLVNQGVNLGNEAYTDAYRGLNDSRDAALRDANTAARTEGRNDIALQQNLRQQALSDYLLERQQPFNEAAAYLTGAPVFNNAPQVNPAQYQMSPADIQGAYGQQYQGALNNYNQQVGARNSKMGATAGLGGSLGAAYIMSSKDFKEDNQPVEYQDVLDAFDKLPVERWKYKNDAKTHIGCYAEDFQAQFGVGDGVGIPVVDAIGVCMAAIKALSEKVQRLEAAQ